MRMWSQKSAKGIIPSLSQICTFFNDCGNSNQSLETTSVAACNCVYRIFYCCFLVTLIMFLWLFACCPKFPGSCPNLKNQPSLIDWLFIVCLFNRFFLVCKKVFSRILFCLLPISDDPSLPQIPTTLQLTKHSANSFWYPHLCELCRRPVLILYRTFFKAKAQRNETNCARQFKSHKKIDTDVFQPFENHKLGHTTQGAHSWKQKVSL